MPASNRKDEDDLSPEAILARAAAARGDVFPEWKPVAHAIPRTYDLINTTGSYLHQYHGQDPSAQQLSGPMRELIAIPALCAKGDLRHAPNHIRRIYRMGVTNKVIFEGASAYAVVVGSALGLPAGLWIIAAIMASGGLLSRPRGGEAKK